MTLLDVPVYPFLISHDYARAPLPARGGNPLCIEATVNHIVISVIGRDCPGVVYAISSALSKEKCNIEELSQTILKGQFASIFIVSAPEDVTEEDIQRVVSLNLEARNMDLTVSARTFEPDTFSSTEETEPFVVTVNGSDQPEIIAMISGIFAEQKVNIENLKAIRVSEDTDECVLVFEVALPLSINRNAFRQMLQAKARNVGLSISIQHQDIFEAIHRVPIV
ncbi:glycine cleavage system protein R [Mailhella massiliensis]|uniref:glycine cleavage system protein R n=1 Tax=Mailhella massiliensis TaxID=1903261 RepID=UPI001EF4F586|nr:ACT domain-containing protein [Mailhella massiliensis]